METHTKTVLKIVILPAILCLVLVYYYAFQTIPDYLMHVDFFNIGQGDSYMITTYTGNQILIDGGPDDSVISSLGHDMPLFDRNIEMVVLTHPHTDHMVGLLSAIKRYNVKKILIPHVAYKSDPYEQFLAEAEAEHAEIIYAKQGERIWLDNATALDVMYPLTDSEAHPKTSDDVNDSSIVAKLTFGKTTMMLMGDAGINIEQEIENKFNVDADLLKVGHHGSKHSSSLEFLEKVTPEFAVIQVGKNNYGHPAPETLTKLEEVHAQVYRNDKNGEVDFISDGTKLKLKENW